MHRTLAGRGDIALTSALTPDERVGLASRRSPSFKDLEVLRFGEEGVGTDAIRRHLQFDAPGTYAFVVWDTLQEPDAAGSRTVYDSQTFEVGASPALGASIAPNDGGPLVGVGALLGVVVGGWSAAGSVLKVRRRRWIDRGRPAARDLGVAAAVGTVVALLLGGFALVAIDLARNPF